MSTIKIKQIKSRIGAPADQKRVLDALGLRKMNRVVEHEETPSILGMWMMLSVHSQAAETNNDEKQAQTIRVGSFEDTFNYVDKNGVRRGYGYELMQLCQVIPNGNLSM